MSKKLEDMIPMTVGPREDHSPFTYVQDEGQLAISANGYYTLDELRYLVRALQEANQLTGQDRWDGQLTPL
jgi:hypothetical protein